MEAAEAPILGRGLQRWQYGILVDHAVPPTGFDSPLAFKEVLEMIGHYELQMKRSEPTWHKLTEGFREVEIAGVLVSPWSAYTDKIDRQYGYPLQWAIRLMDWDIPRMGLKHMNLFWACGCIPRLFFFFIDNVFEEDW